MNQKKILLLCIIFTFLFLFFPIKATTLCDDDYIGRDYTIVSNLHYCTGYNFVGGPFLISSIIDVQQGYYVLSETITNIDLILFFIEILYLTRIFYLVFLKIFKLGNDRNMDQFFRILLLFIFPVVLVMCVNVALLFCSVDTTRMGIRGGYYECRFPFTSHEVASFEPELTSRGYSADEYKYIGLIGDGIFYSLPIVGWVMLFRRFGRRDIPATAAKIEENDEKG